MEFRVTCKARPNGSAHEFKSYPVQVEAIDRRQAEDQAIIQLRDAGMDVRAVERSFLMPVRL
jgi:hypothetical protein